ncbi:MAG: CPBP family intramembrane metalloprotease [Eubacteriales bacterium]|nr:CPBP family intramembrane metalloprotease [Eubacteriales bacterium]
MMEKLFKRNQLHFALVWIVLYVIVFSLTDSASEALGVQGCVTMPLSLLLSAFLFGWIRRNRLSDYYGLRGIPNVNAGKYLYFLPLLVLASANLWNGVTMRFTVLETALTIVSMFCAGFIEEILFRGFLFKAIYRKNAGLAIVVSSLTFGLGHIVNLLNGAALPQTLLQMGYAFTIGYLFTILFLQTQSLLPCILTHGVLNALSVFAVETTLGQDLLASAALIVISVGYAIYLKKSGRVSIA